MGRTSVPVSAEGRDQAPTSVDQPKLTGGSWVRPGQIVIERSFADALAVHVGEAVTLDGRPFHIAGIAVTAATPSYPMSTPGLVWVTRADALRLGAPAPPMYYTLNLRLVDRSQATGFVNELAFSPGTAQLSTMTWQIIRDQDATLVTNAQQDLLIGATLLALLGGASVAVLVGGRMAQQARRVGMLKAIGATPTLIAVVLLAENLLVAIAAAAIGVTAGALAAPTLTNPGAGLIGAPGGPSTGLATLAAGAGLALAVTLLATFVPARRAAKSTTLRSIADAARPPRRAPRLVAASARLPTPLLVGLRLAARRPRRGHADGHQHRDHRGHRGRCAHLRAVRPNRQTRARWASRRRPADHSRQSGAPGHHAHARRFGRDRHDLHCLGRRHRRPPPAGGDPRPRGDSPPSRRRPHLRPVGTCPGRWRSSASLLASGSTRPQAPTTPSPCPRHGHCSPPPAAYCSSRPPWRRSLHEETPLARPPPLF